MSPNGQKQDVTMAKDSENDNQYPDTNAINPLFRDFPHAPTSGSTTLDHESNTDKTLESEGLIPLSTNNLKYVL